MFVLDVSALSFPFRQNLKEVQRRRRDLVNQLRESKEILKTTPSILQTFFSMSCDEGPIPEFIYMQLLLINIIVIISSSGSSIGIIVRFFKTRTVFPGVVLFLLGAVLW